MRKWHLILVHEYNLPIERLKNYSREWVLIHKDIIIVWNYFQLFYHSILWYPKKKINSIAKVK